jgi:hypothetical protein
VIWLILKKYGKREIFFAVLSGFEEFIFTAKTRASRSHFLALQGE